MGEGVSTGTVGEYPVPACAGITRGVLGEEADDALDADGRSA
jgi:hypothetical protein